MATLSQARDAFQLRLLTFLYRGSTSSSLVLKGGVAMRVLTESARFTQDLDFDHDPHRSLASLQNTVRTAIDRAIHGSGLIDTSISESKQTDTVARWKISGRTSTGENLHLAVEVSRRQTPDPNHVLKIPVQIADRTLPRVYVSVYDEQTLADNKLAALIDDRRTAPRDIYDLELLLARGVVPSAGSVENLGGAVPDKDRRRCGLMKALHWSTRLELVLAEPSALRVLDTASIIQLAKNVRQDISKPSVERWIQEAVAANRLARVVRGLFLNRLITPPPQLCEAAVWLRPGAVISLQTVLGDSGVWSNYTDWVTAVVPLSSRYATPSLGRVETAGGTFVFRGLPERILETGAENDRLVAGVDYRRATPEAALMHWLYLSSSPRSRMSTPPLDLDLDALDLKRLKRLAIAMRLDANLTVWRNRPAFAHQ